MRWARSPSKTLRDIGGDRIIAANVPRSPVVIDGRYVTGASAGDLCLQGARTMCR